MLEQYVGDQVVIRSTSDSVEQVKEAFGESAEVETTETKQTETTTEKKPPAKVDKAEPKADETETEEEPAEEEPAEEKADAEKVKPKKAAPETVPRSRLNQEIQRRKDLERQLAEKNREKPEKTETPESTEPKTFSGKPEPTIADFQDNEKYPDPYAALNKATADWVRAETRAEIAEQQRLDAIEAARLERIAPFNQQLKETLKRRPDYQDAVSGSTVDLSGYMEAFIFDSTIGPDLLLHFAENPEDAEAIVAKGARGQATGMIELETRIKAEIKAGSSEEEETETEEEKVAAAALPKKKLVSKAPPPVPRLKSAGPQPKTLQELAGPTDNSGIRVQFNPEYEKAAKARRGT